MKMSDRKKKILQIVVDEYINTAVPVSSKSITEKHLTDVSSATVRNELASLEELGYLTQFHTSGGRVPSPQAYRFYIEELMEKGNLSQSDLDYIENAFASKSHDVEHLIKSVSSVISELTDYTSVAITPHADAETIRSVSLISCGENTALRVPITIRAFPSRMRRPRVGARLINFSRPFLARLVVASPSSAPKAMIKATSPAANSSPMASAANMAMQMSSADEIFAIPRL